MDEYKCCDYCYVPLIDKEFYVPNESEFRFCSRKCGHKWCKRQQNALEQLEQ